MAAYYANPSVLSHTTSLQPYGHHNETNGQNQSSSIYNLPTDSEGEAEVDELESDTEDEHGASASTTGQKKGGKRAGERAPGTTLLPMARVENIIQADGITSSLSMSKEAVFVLSIATEEFVKRMAQAGHRQASASRRNIVNYADMASSTQQYQEFMFLQDTIPEPMLLSEALERKLAKEKEDLEANPAMSSAIQTQPTPSAPMPSISQANGKSKSKSRTVNGKEKASASVSASTAPRGDHRKQPAKDDRTDEPAPISVARTSSGRVIRSTRAAREAVQDGISRTTPNGSAHPREQDESWSGSTSPRRPPASHRSSSDHGSTPQSFNPSWPGQFTGPASGFLQDPQSAFGRMAQNPGRTIYSQQPRSENGVYR
ncbi:hypothetical protein HYDPIDRAFT_28381 [Hydnomerulius pinastri MD-312]|uniref:Transcription factor CBF/NF-Y/archaeal histone domain-containing protein n=1 Tax=Hydnomerulius pinastri MD-312 TaxID=994086 RepID=A0A0C9WFS3_9AGAM|nr:hypothetical protein HYDPIDRAFT_28381 [Hydnomerulius pinastri MD-312]